MAVINAFVNADVAAGKKGNPALVSGGQLRSFVSVFEVASGDDDGSIYKIAKLPANAILTSLTLNSDAITGLTSIDCGLYKESGVVADANLFLSAEDIAAGQAIGTAQDAMEDLALENLGKKLYEQLGLTVATATETAYDLALTANTVGSAAGTIVVRGTYILG